MKVLGWLKILRDLLCELRAFAFRSFQSNGLCQPLKPLNSTEFAGFSKGEMRAVR
jgi:hypothetical protein